MEKILNKLIFMLRAPELKWKLVVNGERTWRR
jgi:hypothetical protein